MDKNREITRKSPFSVGLVLVDGFALMSFSAVVEPLRAANLLAEKDVYDISFIPASGNSAVSSGGVVVQGDAKIGERRKFDLLLVLAGGDPFRFADKRVMNWLRQQVRRCDLLGGVSGGPVILARAGLMDGRRMTVHWEHAASLAELDPYLLLERTLYVKDRDRITCAGGIAPLDMMHGLLAEHHGETFAMQVSEWFMHTDIRPSGGPQRAGLAQRYGVTNKYVLLAIEAMVNHVADPLELSDLALLVERSPRQLSRLFQDKLKVAPMSLYRDIRIEKARNLLSQSHLSITEIALATGFATPAHFSRTFREHEGCAPSDFRK